MKTRLFITFCVFFIMGASNSCIEEPTGNSVCSDNQPHCTSSPPCLGQWVGNDCQIGGITGICTDTGNPNAGILTPCCSCDNTVRIEVEE